MDDLIASSGVSYRALTMPSFMDNLLRQVQAIKNPGVFVTPISGGRKLPSCATRDIAAVAARLLLDDSWSGTGHVAVLGPQDLSFNDMAQIMSEVLGKPVRYQQIPAQALKDRLTGAGMSDAMAQATADMMAAKDQGLDNAEPRTPESTTPTTFCQWCQEDPQAGRPRLTTTARPAQLMPANEGPTTQMSYVALGDAYSIPELAHRHPAGVPVQPVLPRGLGPQATGLVLTMRNRP